MRIVLYLLLFSLIFTINLRALEEKAIYADVLLKTTKSWDGVVFPEYPKGEPEITILKIIIPPHMQLPIHKHPIINAGILLKGKLTVETEDNEKLYLKEGDSIAEVVNKWHHGINESDEPVEILVFYAGIKDMPITIKKENTK